MERNEMIEEVLRKKFGESATIDVRMYGMLADIEITYTDGMSFSDAREWIDDNIRYVNNITLYRKYSDERVMEALRTLYESDHETIRKVEELLAMQSIE